MATAEKNEVRGPTAPYISFLTKKNVMKDMKEHGIPSRIDRSVFPNLAGGTVGQLLPALKFLKLTTDAGLPTDELRRLVAAYGSAENWSAELAKIVRGAYAPLFKLNLETASPSQFNELFRATYPGTEDVSRKSQTFFLNAAREAGIKVSPLIMKNKKPRVASSKKRGSKAGGNKARQEGTHENNGTPNVDRLPSEILLGFYDTNMAQAEQDAIWTLIRHFKAKGQ